MANGDDPKEGRIASVRPEGGAGRGANGPDGAMVASLITERWSIDPSETVTIDIDGATHRIGLTLTGPRHRYQWWIALEEAPPAADPWALLVDALDALFGQFIESERDYRALPSGPGVAFMGATFDVTVEHRVPEVEKLADRLLADSEASED